MSNTAKEFKANICEKATKFYIQEVNGNLKANNSDKQKPL